MLDTHFILGMAKSKGIVKAILDIDQVLLAEGEISLPLIERTVAAETPAAPNH